MQVRILTYVINAQTFFYILEYFGFQANMEMKGRFPPSSKRKIRKINASRSYSRGDSYILVLVSNRSQIGKRVTRRPLPDSSKRPHFVI
jgi:hypothetical protein